MYTKSTDNTLVVALDLETTIRGGWNSKYLNYSLNGMSKGTNRPKADPYCSNNYPVLTGYSYLSNMHDKVFNQVLLNDSLWDVLEELENCTSDGKHLMLIGVNVGFDYKYMLEYMKGYKGYYTNKILDLLLNRTMLWDLSVVEYMLSGQINKFSSMKQLLDINGITSVVKGDLAEEYWDQGIDTTLIPTDELERYLQSDVIATQEIYLKQLEEIKARIEKTPQFGRLLYDNMNGVVNTNQMSHNCFGLHAAKFNKYIHNTSTALKNTSDILDMQVQDYFKHMSTPKEVQELFKDNYRGSTFIAMIAYNQGVTYHVKETEMKDGKVVTYKSGTRKGLPKLRKRAKTYIPRDRSYGREHVIPIPSSLFTLGGNPKIDESTLQLLVSNNSPLPLGPYEKRILRAYLGLKKVEKEDSTYGTGLIKNLPNKQNITRADGIEVVPLTTEFNHTSTATGRLSSTRINMQNLKGG